MFGGSRQVYYRRINKESQMQEKSQAAISLVQEVRHLLPRIDTRKLYHMVNEPLRATGMGIRHNLYWHTNHPDVSITYNKYILKKYYGI